MCEDAALLGDVLVTSIILSFTMDSRATQSVLPDAKFLARG